MNALWLVVLGVAWMLIAWTSAGWRGRWWVGASVAVGVVAANVPPRNPAGVVALAVAAAWPLALALRRTSPRFAKWFGGGLGLALCAWGLSSLAAAFHYIQRRQPVVEEAMPSELLGQAHPLRLRTQDDLELGAWWIDGRSGSATIISLHGNGGSRTRSLPYVQWFAKRGHAVLAVTARAHGDSDGSTNDLGKSARWDVIAALHEARRRRPDAPCLIVARSLGCAAALFALDEGALADGYLLEAPYLDLRSAMHDRLDRKLPAPLSWLAVEGLIAAGDLWMPSPHEHAPGRRLLSIPASIPTLLLFGRTDRQAPEARFTDWISQRPETQVARLEPGGHRPLLPRDRPGFTRLCNQWIGANFPLR